LDVCFEIVDLDQEIMMRKNVILRDGERTVGIGLLV